MASPTPEGRSVRALGAKRRQPGVPAHGELIRRLRAATQEDPSLVALFDARSIAGERHLLSAWAHLGRSRRGGSARLRDRGAEFALYLSGDDQLGRALSKVGISESTEAFVLVAERPRSVEELLKRFELEADPAAYPLPLTAATLDRLGISEPERAAVPPESWEGLVLERVALVDLSASGAPARPEPPSPPRRKG